MTYPELLERLGPLPTCSEVGTFIGRYYESVYTLVKQGKLEAITTSTGRKRIVLNSLVEYLKRQEVTAANVVSALEAQKAAINVSLNGRTTGAARAPHQRKKKEAAAK
jgi:hypothetical protein